MINKISKIKNKIKGKTGFTILETIVAISVLSLSISGAFSAVQQSLSQSIMAKEEIQAFYLAQEAIELIRNKRDVNLLRNLNNVPTNWLYEMAQNNTDPCWFGKVCKVDASVNNPTPTYCGDEWGTCPKLNQFTTNFLYNHQPLDSNNTETKFTREIQLESINGNEIAVIVRIAWSKGIFNREFQAKTHLFNWQIGN